MPVALLCYAGRITMLRSLAMTTTTIRLPPELKARVARAAERAGTTERNFRLTISADPVGSTVYIHFLCVRSLEDSKLGIRTQQKCAFVGRTSRNKPIRSTTLFDPCSDRL